MTLKSVFFHLIAVAVLLAKARYQRAVSAVSVDEVQIQRYESTGQRYRLMAEINPFQPSSVPSMQPSSRPTSAPSSQPTQRPSQQRVALPTSQPSGYPSTHPSSEPTLCPSSQPSSRPSMQPSISPTTTPTSAPTLQPFSHPTRMPSIQPSAQPKSHPSAIPSATPSADPSLQPTNAPLPSPTGRPTTLPSVQPSQMPTSQPTYAPSSYPSTNPTCQPTVNPSCNPTCQPSSLPTASPIADPTSCPSTRPSGIPSVQPSQSPSGGPTTQPSSLPSSQPSKVPSSSPTDAPTAQPSSLPSMRPSITPTSEPTFQPISDPTSLPTVQPSAQPFIMPTSLPTMQPSIQPTCQPTSEPTQPTTQPSEEPSRQPTNTPSAHPSTSPTVQPYSLPTSQPSRQPSFQPSSQPSGGPSYQPTVIPSNQPTKAPTRQPTLQPRSCPSIQPSAIPTTQPSSVPSTQPSRVPSVSPSGQPSSVPTSSAPTSIPSALPTKFPTTSSPTIPGETNPPSDVPTSGPSFDLDFSSNSLYTLHNENLDFYSTRSNSFTYGSFFFKGLRVDGPCEEWSNFVDNVILLPTDELQFTGLTLDSSYFNYERQSSESIIAQCYDVDIIRNIVKSMQERTTYSADCGSRLWRVFSCNEEPVICVNCKLNCVATEACPGRSFVINPCEACSFLAIASTVLHLEFENLRLYPRIVNSLQIVAESQSSITVTGNLSSAGNVDCTAIISTSLQLVSSVVDISESGNGNLVMESSGVFNIALQRLHPDTDYTVICFTSSFFGHTMPLEEALASNVSAKTACCREIISMKTHSLIVQFIPGNSRPESVFVLALNSQPTESVVMDLSSRHIQIDCETNAIISEDVEPIIVPSQFVFYPASSSLTAEFTIRGLETGCYLFTAVAAGDAIEYEPLNVTYSLESFRTAPLVPKLSSVLLGDNLLTLLFNFDSNTDMGADIVATGALFDCNLLVEFSASDSSACKWINTTQLQADFSESAVANFPTIGQSAVVNGGFIRAACVTTDLCAAYEYIDRVNATILAPINPVRIYSLLQVSRVILLGSNVVLDPTASFGQGGRAWTSVIWTVEGNSCQNEAEAIALLLNNEHSTDTVNVVNLDASILPIVPCTLTFTLQLVDFLQRTAVSSATLELRFGSSSTSNNPATSSVIPRVSLFLQERTVRRWRKLRVEANASIPLVAGNNTQLPLRYTWRLYEGATFMNTLQSISRSQRIFQLPPFSLLPATNYTVVLQVSLAGNTMSSVPIESTTQQISFIVARSGAVARINGQPAMTNQFSDVIILDASRSYDVDFPDDASLLSYSWTCQTLLPEFGNDCDGFPVETNQSLISLPPQTLSPQVYSIQVTVLSSSGRFSKANLQLTIADEVLPTILIAPLQNSKVDPNKKLIIHGEVYGHDTEDGAASVAEWSSPAFDSLAAPGIALSPVARRLSGQSNSFSLSLAPNSLTPGLTYIFELSAAYEGSNKLTVAAVEVVVNAPPSGGIITTTPAEGVGLFTTFALSTGRWTDDSADLPLSFSFGYYNDDSSRKNLVKPIGEVPYVNSSLGQGLSNLGFEVTCVAYAFDIYESAAMLEQSVVVKQPASILTEVLDAVSSNLAVALQNEDTVLMVQIVQSALARMNAVDCSTPVECASINRKFCSTTPRTCGKCLDGFIGIEGHSNIPCNDSSRIRSIGSSCSVSSDCISGNCTAGHCHDVLKVCPNDCDIDGMCTYFNSRGEQVLECFSLDVACYAKCVCNIRFGVDCTLKAFEYEKLLIAREEMCESLEESLLYQDVSEDVVQSRAVNVASILIDIDQITDAAIFACTNVLLDTINSDSVVSCQGSGFDLFINALSNVLEKGPNLPDGLLPNVTSAVNELTIGCLSEIAVGESSLSQAASNIRVSTILIEDSENASVAAPQTDFEGFNEAEASAVEIDTSNADDAGATTFGVTVIQYTNNPHGSLLANSSSVVVETTAFSSSSRRRLDFPSSSIGVTVTLVNVEPIDYDELEVETVEVRCFELKDHDYEESVTCPNGEKFTVTCPSNRKGVKEFSCPGFKTVPRCTMWDGEEFRVNPDCEVVDFTTETTTCFCPASTTDRRQLQTVQEAREFSSRFLVIGNEVGSTFNRAPSVSDVRQNVVIFATICAVLGIYVIGLIWFLYRDFYQQPGLSSSKSAIQQDTPKILVQRRTIKQFYRSIFPPEFLSETWYILLWKRLLLEHSFITLFAPYDARSEYFHVKWTVAVARLIVFLFVNALVATFMYADDGYCEEFDERRECRDATSTGGFFHICEWNKDNESCSFNRPEITFVTSVILTLIVALLSIPLRGFIKLLSDRISVLLREFSYGTHRTTVREKQTLGYYDFQPNLVDDEFKSIVRPKSLFLMAARLEKAQYSMDYLSAQHEADLLTEQQKVRYDFERNHRVNGFAYDFETISHTRYGRPSFFGTQPHLKRILGARRRAAKVKTVMGKLRTQEEKESFLMRVFLVELFTGTHRQVVSTYLLGAAELALATDGSIDKMLQYVSIVLLPAMLLVMLWYVFQFALSIGSRSTNLWLLITFLSFLQDSLILQPFRIWLKWVVINSSVIDTVHDTFEHFILRSRIILMRTKGIIREASGLVQHFNPACRAARSFPELPVARLLIAMSDYDLPIPYQPNIFMQPYLLLLSIILLVVFLPDILQDPAMEMVASLLFDFSLIGFFEFGSYNPVAAGIVAGFIVTAGIVWHARAVSELHREKLQKVQSVNQSVFDELDAFDGDAVDDSSALQLTENKHRNFYPAREESLEELGKPSKYAVSSLEQRASLAGQASKHFTSLISRAPKEAVAESKEDKIPSFFRDDNPNTNQLEHQHVIEVSQLRDNLNRAFDQTNYVTPITTQVLGPPIASNQHALGMQIVSGHPLRGANEEEQQSPEVARRGIKGPGGDPVELIGRLNDIDTAWKYYDPLVRESMKSAEAAVAGHELFSSRLEGIHNFSARRALQIGPSAGPRYAHRRSKKERNRDRRPNEPQGNKAIEVLGSTGEHATNNSPPPGPGRSSLQEVKGDQFQPMMSMSDMHRSMGDLLTQQHPTHPLAAHESRVTSALRTLNVTPGGFRPSMKDNKKSRPARFRQKEAEDSSSSLAQRMGPGSSLASGEHLLHISQQHTAQEDDTAPAALDLAGRSSAVTGPGAQVHR